MMLIILVPIFRTHGKQLINLQSTGFCMMRKFGSHRFYINIEFESYAELRLVALE